VHNEILPLNPHPVRCCIRKLQAESRNILEFLDTYIPTNITLSGDFSALVVPLKAQKLYPVAA
jgi:hypothetical protein